MKIAIIGHGKMGKLIQELALAKGHSIIAILDSKSSINDDCTKESLKNAEVCIDFSIPDAVLKNVQTLASLKKKYCYGNNWLARTLFRN